MREGNETYLVGVFHSFRSPEKRTPPVTLSDISSRRKTIQPVKSFTSRCSFPPLFLVGGLKSETWLLYASQKFALRRKTYLSGLTGSRCCWKTSDSGAFPLVPGETRRKGKKEGSLLDSDNLSEGIGSLCHAIRDGGDRKSLYAPTAHTHVGCHAPLLTRVSVSLSGLRQHVRRCGCSRW